MSPREHEIAVAWVAHVRACVAERRPLELLEEKLRITQLYIANFTDGVWR